MGACHILCGINTFSKRLFAIPMLKRDGKSGLAAIKEIFRRARSLPDYLVSDKVFAKTDPDYLQLVFFVFFFILVLKIEQDLNFVSGRRVFIQAYSRLS